MKVEQIWAEINKVMDNIFGFNFHPVSASDICDWLIWNDGVYFPHEKANMTQKMNEIAMDMLLKGVY